MSTNISEIDQSFENAKKFLAELEELIVVQKESYLIHTQRLEGIKFLWERVQALRRLELSSLEQKKQEGSVIETKNLNNDLKIPESLE